MKRTQMWAIALAVVDSRDCPKCGRTKGSPCKNLRRPSWKPEKDLVLPHRERYP